MLPLSRPIQSVIVLSDIHSRIFQHDVSTLEIPRFNMKNFRLTIVDTPGFGDGLEGTDAWQVRLYLSSTQLSLLTLSGPEVEG